jgi:hypothetical protein
LKRVAFATAYFDCRDEKAFISAEIWHVVRTDTVMTCASEKYSKRLS